MLHALEHIRRMRGGAQAHLLRCSDGGYYVVKFQNKPQHRRVLVNELLGTKLAARLGLPVAQVAVVDVPEALIRYTADLVMQLGQSSVPCRAGLQFASRYPGDPRELTLHDFLPDEQLREVENLRSEEHTSELQSRLHLVCRLLLEKKKNTSDFITHRKT